MKKGTFACSQQAGLLETAEEFRALIRARTREALLDIVEEELKELCGPSHHPGTESEYFRSGSVESPVSIEGRRENLRRPRVRQRLADGETKEAILESWQLARDPGQSVSSASISSTSSRCNGTT